MVTYRWCVLYSLHHFHGYKHMTEAPPPLTWVPEVPGHHGASEDEKSVPLKEVQAPQLR